MDAPQVDEPALYFDCPELAEDALAAWAAELQALNDRRDALIRGALAAGVKRSTIEQLGVAAGTTTDRVIKKYGKGVDIAVPNPPTVEYVSLLRARVDRLNAQPDRPPVKTRQGQARVAYTMTMRDAAVAIEEPGPLPEDAQLQDLAARYRRGIRPITDDGWTDGATKALAQLAQEITIIRRHGEAAFTDYFDPDEVAAGRALLAETNRKSREELLSSHGYSDMDELLADPRLDDTEPSDG